MATESTEVEIIKLLRTSGAGSHLSGQEISEGLGVTRSAVWKHVGALRKLGYSIEGSTKKGYRLADAPGLFNSVEVASILDTDFVGRELHFFDSIDSTNSKAGELARGGAPEGTAVIADTQKIGRGRVGRRWHSPAGRNLYTSIILRPKLAPRQVQNLTLVVAVAVAETIYKFCDNSTTVKWPNDILVGSKKVAGILTEMASEADSISHIVVGVGVNLNMTREETEALTGELGCPITSIFTEKAGAETGVEIMSGGGLEIPRATFTKSLYSNLEKWYKVYVDRGFAPVKEAWLGYFDKLGESVTISPYGGGTPIKGSCLGIDDDGALLLRTTGGATERVIAGEME